MDHSQDVRIQCPHQGKEPDLHGLGLHYNDVLVVQNTKFKHNCQALVKIQCKATNFIQVKPPYYSLVHERDSGQTWLPIQICYCQQSLGTPKNRCKQHKVVDIDQTEMLCCYILGLPVRKYHYVYLCLFIYLFKLLYTTGGISDLKIHQNLRRTRKATQVLYGPIEVAT